MGQTGKELHFYPGQKLLLLLSSGKVVLRSEAWGGPSARVHDANMDATPTTPGRYLIYREESYITRTWPWSSIRWGTKLQDKLSDVWYQLNVNTWASLLKDKGISRQQVIDQNFRLYGQKRVPDSWVFNDFGPIAIRYFVDRNGNGRFDQGKETLMGEMFHTTPDNEAQSRRGQPLVMTESHGCIHLKPPDRDLLKKEGAFEYGTPFIVHDYSERFK
jgi:hypothetical protein